MDCKILDCQEVATHRVLHPFGRSNLCDGHALAVANDEDETWAALEFACRYGPVEDPPIEASERGPEYARPDGLG